MTVPVTAPEDPLVLITTPGPVQLLSFAKMNAHRPPVLEQLGPAIFQDAFATAVWVVFPKSEETAAAKNDGAGSGVVTVTV
jgi:hypothetical protein